MNQEFAITFDLWDTVIVDDSDEEMRAQMGLRPKREERIHVVWNAYRQHSSFAFEQIRHACVTVNDEFNRVWHDEFVTWTVPERLDRISAVLECGLPGEVLDDAVFKLENMEIEIPPRAMPGVREALEKISQMFSLGVVSDAIVTPGRNLRKWLELNGVLKYFSAFAFSDEVGYSKPHPSMFQSAARQLDVPVQNLVHVGDREHNDIRGAHALGMRAVLFTGSRSADAAETTADAVCNHCSELPTVLERLVGSAVAK